MSISQVETKVSKSSIRKKLLAGATATVMALGALVGFAGPAVANGDLAYTSAAISGENKIVTLTFNKALQLATGYQSTLKESVTFASNGNDFVALGVSDTVEINGSTIVVTFNSALTGSTNKIKVEANALEDAGDNGEVSVEVTTEAIVADTTAPLFVSAATSADGTKVVLTYDEALDSTTAAAGDFAVDVDGTPNTVTGVAVAGLTVELTLTTTVAFGELVTVGYTDPADPLDPAIQDAAGNRAATLADTTPVTNNVPAPPAPDTTAPVISAVSVTGTSQTGTTLNFTSDEAGTYFYLVYAAAATAPTDAEVVAQGTAVVKGTESATATAMTAAITGLTAGTAYKIYLVVRDAANNLSLVSDTAITTTAATVAPAPSSGGGGVATVVPPTPVVAPTPVAAPVRTPTGAFAANSAKLTKELRVSIRKALAANPNAKAAICRGFVASGAATAADRKLARDRSTAVCNLITKLNPELDVEVKKVVVVSSSKQLRNVRMVLR
jgi:uncharacterized repeat protein (TIGR02059 family)